jgi:hypothetical protein
VRLDCPTRDDQLDDRLMALSSELIQVVTNDLQGAAVAVAGRIESQGWTV